MEYCNYLVVQVTADGTKSTKMSHLMEKVNKAHGMQAC